MSLTEPRDAKRSLRALMRARTVASAHALIDAVLALALPADAILAGVMPLRSEPDLMPAWHELHRRGHVVVFPETTPAGKALLFRHWQPGVPLLAGRFGTVHPDGPETVPDILFVPLLAWDRRLARIGYGGGYYDRTLASLPRAVAIGFGFASQEVASVPTGPYDVPLDAMVSDRGVVTAGDRNFADIVSGRHRRPQRS